MYTKQTEYFVFRSLGSTHSFGLVGRVDEVQTINLTKMKDLGKDACNFYWERGMEFGTSLKVTRSGGGNNKEITQTGKFNFWQRDVNPRLEENPVAYTGYSASQNPVVSFNANDNPEILNGDVVRLASANHPTALGGIDFQITNVDHSAGTFTIEPTLAQSPGAAAGAGTFTRQNWLRTFAPPYSFIADIDRSNPLKIYLTTTPEYSIGQELTIHMSPNNGASELNNVTGTITDIMDNELAIEMDIDATNVSRFFFPARNAPKRYTPAYVVPAGMNTVKALAEEINPSGGATKRTASLNEVPGGEIVLGGGVNTDPLGEEDDNILIKVTKKVLV